MTVYVDLLFGLNTVINYLLLRGSAALSGGGGGVWRLLAAASLGGVYAVAVVLPGLLWLESVVCQTVVGILMLLAAFGWRKSTIKQGLFFFALSFAFGGVVLLVVQAAEPDCVFLGGRAYYAVSMPAMLLLAGACYAVAAVILDGCGVHTGGDILPITVMVQGRSVPIKALRDTGNTLRDPISGQTVLIADGSVLDGLLPEAGLQQHLLQDPVSLMQRLSAQYPRFRFRLVTYRAIGVEQGMLLGLRCQVKAGKHTCRTLVAFSPAQISSDGTFQALWGGAVT